MSAAELPSKARVAGGVFAVLPEEAAGRAAAPLASCEHGCVTYLPPELYAEIERSLPLACVDFVPVRHDADGAVEVGLILRDSPFGDVWCHLGGRVLRGETIAGAIRRHAAETLGAEVDLPSDPQPDYVYQWFPPDMVPSDAPAHGSDPRKHAIGLSFVVALTGAITPRGEALDFAFFPLAGLPQPLWPGVDGLLQRLLPSQPT
ncbi:DUF4916 domain-containing protein [Microbacterium sp. zg.Y909]|uniref:DUF4916 domain-containing protein n=1 Tax=Microbacterium sp. zg.Y909 TaxID=2969413 RepID=UPI00214BC780|nr:DUF4916 domain-containing protein [Microbacterium sp. zg.Y909]MCR2824236.1 DUF4916 domain-containing protein [Microbacterium sp. zg.Y909]